MGKKTKSWIVLFFLAILSACGNHIDIYIPSDIPTGTPYNVKINAGSATVMIPTPNSTEEFFLILYTSASGSRSHMTKIDGGIVKDGVGTTQSASSAKIAPNPMDSFLRKTEAEAAEETLLSPVSKISPKTLSYILPQKRTFNVLDKTDDSRSYLTVWADLVSSSANSAFYVDSSLSPDIRNDSAFLPAVDKLRSNFDAIIAPLDREFFGQESQVDDLAPIIILMSPVLNRMSADAQGNILGFFYSHDLFSDGRYPESNGTEIFYIAAFDEKLTPLRNVPAGDIINYCTDKIFLGTLAHEFQHMINFNQHVFVNRGKSEEDWLNEGLSHLAEDLTGYGWGNMPFVNLYLADPASYPLTGKPNSAGARGASYLFSRYLYENSHGMTGMEVTRRLAAGPAVGTKNVEKSLGTDFGELFSDWLSTLALSNTGLGTYPKYSYKPPVVYPQDSQIGPFQIGINLRGTNGGYNLEGPWFEKFETVSLALNPAAGSFYEIKASDSGEVKIELTFSGNRGSGLVVIPTKK